MFERDRHSYITFGWIATIIGVLLFFAVLNSKYAETQQSSEYAHKCAEQFKSLSATPAVIAPLTGDLEEPDRAQQDKYNPDWCDLAAQQSMAESTYWMNVAAFATVIFTAWGAFLIWRTLLATQETVLITRRIGEAQVRAYVRVKSARIRKTVPFVADHRRRETLVDFEIENTGQSPARDIMLSINWTHRKFNEVPELGKVEKGRWGKRYFAMGAGGTHIESQSYVFEVSSKNWLYMKGFKSDDGKENDFRISIYGRLEYTDVFDVRRFSEWEFAFDSYYLGGGFDGIIHPFARGDIMDLSYCYATAEKEIG